MQEQLQLMSHMRFYRGHGNIHRMSRPPRGLQGLFTVELPSLLIESHYLAAKYDLTD